MLFYNDAAKILIISETSKHLTKFLPKDMGYLVNFPYIRKKEKDRRAKSFP